MANTDLELTTIIKVNPVMVRDIEKILPTTAKVSSSVFKSTDKQLSPAIKAGVSFLQGIDKSLLSTIKAGVTIKKDNTKKLTSSIKASSDVKKMVGKRVTTISKINPIISRVTGKHLTPITKINSIFSKNIDKIINTVIKVSTTKEINAATLTMAYNGNAELGLGAEEGAQFDIIVTGTFSTFTIAMNGKTLTYTENCVAQTITIDNVNATVKNGTTNKLSKVTGDVADFLKLIPGPNTISYTKVGGNVSFVWDFRPQFI